MLRILRERQSTKRPHGRSSGRPLLDTEQHHDIAGLLFLALSICVTLSMVPIRLFGEGAEHMFPTGNLMGIVGQSIYETGYALIGVGLWALPIPGLIAAAASFSWIRRERGIRWGILVVTLALLAPLAVFQFTAEAGSPFAHAFPATAAGWIGSTLGLYLAALFSWFGALVVLLILASVACVATIRLNLIKAFCSLLPVAFRSFATSRHWQRLNPRARKERNTSDGKQSLHPFFAEAADEPAPVDLAPLIETPKTPSRRRRRSSDVAIMEQVADTELVAAEPINDDRPSAELLTLGDKPSSRITNAALDHLGQVLLQTLETFRVEGRIVGRTTGPVVTQFEVVPAPGIKVSKIASLDADIALALKAPSVRIVAPIPGKGAVGVEVPNPDPEIVYLREIIESPPFVNARGALPLALGKDLAGRPHVADLARMPHVLIAGATGAGKSVCINTIVTSLIYRHGPETLRLLMIDPKMVELSIYKDLPHLRHPVVTDPKDAAMVLKWAVHEMERRYGLLSVNGARSLSEFNAKLARGKELWTPSPTGSDKEPYEDGPLPYIVVIVDELADLMMTVGNDIEKPLCQLAQKARAIGIHLIVATQRPSVNVITGLIKANFPSRIAFRVSSKVDSRTILDQNGADALLGNGDMLFLPPGTADSVRIQGAFLSTEDTERLMDWFRQKYPDYRLNEEDVVETMRAMEEDEETNETSFTEDRDELFREAALVCVQYQQGSTSLLQRRLRVGYGRAARIIDQLHQAGILGPPEGSKPREVLVGAEGLELLLGNETTDSSPSPFR